MEPRVKKVFFVLTVAFIIVSPLGVCKFGGSYWVLYPAVAFFSLLPVAGTAKLELINNLGFFSAVTCTFFLFRFLNPIAALLGLTEKGVLWYFFVIAFFQGFFTQAAWRVFRNLHSRDVSYKGGTRRSIIITYGLIMFAPQAFLWFLTDPTDSYPDRVWSGFIMKHFDYFSLIFYGVFVGIFIITLTRHTPESILYSHSVDGRVVKLNQYLRKRFVYPIILALIVISESFYSAKNYAAILAALFSLCLYYLYFNLIAHINYRYHGEKPELKELVGEPGPIALFLIIFVILLIGGCFGFLQGFSEP